MNELKQIIETAIDRAYQLKKNTDDPHQDTYAGEAIALGTEILALIELGSDPDWTLEKALSME